MRPPFSALIGAVLLLGGTVATAQHQPLVTFKPDEIRWGDGPAALPSGVKAARLHGSAGAVGPFTVRLKLPANYKAAPHWHPVDEFVTVISGTVYFGMGDTFDPTQGKGFSVGSFVVLPARTPHFTWTTDEAIIQAQAIAPFEVIYVNPADDPRTR